MRNILLIILAVILSACSMEKMAEKILPEDVQIRAASDATRIMDRDPAVFEAFYTEADTRSREDFDNQVEAVLANVASGEILRRDIVAAQSNVSKSLGEGTQRTYSVTYEVQTDTDFSLIVLDYVRNDDKPLTLNNINVKRSETSPVRAGLATAAKIAKIIGAIFLVFLLALVFFLIRHSRKKRADKKSI